MANGEWPFWLQVPSTVTTTFSGYCGHGTPSGVQCFYCQHPALGPAAPQTFSLGGWQCPGCQRCFSPSVTECRYCGPQRESAAESITGPVSDLCITPVSCTCHTEGGLCGCGEDGDTDNGPCTSFNCGC